MTDGTGMGEDGAGEQDIDEIYLALGEVSLLFQLLLLDGNTSMFSSEWNDVAEKMAERIFRHGFIRKKNGGSTMIVTPRGKVYLRRIILNRT